MGENTNKEQFLVFLHQRIKTEKNPFDKAALIRQLGYLRHQEALRTGEEDLAGYVADQYLKEYTSFVTENTPSSVNNYSVEVTRLLKARPTRVNPLKWESVLEKFDYSNSTKDTLPCKGKYFDCNHLEVEELKAFSGIDSVDPNIEAISSQNMNTEGQALLEDGMPPQQAPIQRALSDQQGKPSSSVVQVNRSCQTDPMPHPVLGFNPINNSSNKSLAGQLPALFNNYSLKVNPPQVPKEETTFNGFRTAREEFAIQALKKGGSNPSGQQQFAPIYGTSNKSLGGRRSVKHNFVPPVQPVANELQKRIFGGLEKSEQEESMDERLKNIDPKMVELINNEIMHKFNPVDWNDIAGLDYAKSTIQEAVVWPLLRPDIFTGIRRPPRGILLFGPPGTGKTLIGKCIASQSKSTFFSISASALTSKWVGDGEKMVRALFAVAAIHQPAVIFIDEIDSLLSQRSNDEHESSRRIKTEFLVQLDGASTSQEDRLLIVGATNRPQELDEAARRRLVRRLYIPLPELEARKQILKNLLKSVSNSVTEDQLYEISQFSEGYSGADMECLCREASMEPIRCIPASQIPHFNQNEVRPVNIDDFRLAITRVKASVSQDDIQQYITWNKMFGSGK